MVSPADIAYTSHCSEYRCQGDVYRSASFPEGPPDDAVKYWMVMNRTCHLYEDDERAIKLPHLVFCAVLDIENVITREKGSQNPKNQIKNIITGKTEHLGFLPEHAEAGLEHPLVVHFNLLRSVSIERCPPAKTKLLELQSPFCEHMIQRFIRWFYTVSVNDEMLRSSAYVDSVASKIEE